MLIKIDITKKHPTVDGTPIIVCGNSGYQIQFAFDEEWAGLQFKTARFVYRKAGKARYIDVPFSGDTVDVPVFCEIGFVWVGVYTDLLQTTTPAKIPCEYSIRCKSGESVEEITQELYDQMLALFNQVAQEQDVAAAAAQTATEASEAAQEAAEVAKEAIGGVVSKVIEGNGTKYVSFWVGTQAEYDAIESKVENCMYIITDDTAPEDLAKKIEELEGSAFTHACAGNSQYFRRYNNGIAEGWARFDMKGAIKNPSGSMFISNPFTFTSPEFLNGITSDDVYVYEVNPTFAVEAPAPVMLMQYPPEEYGGPRRHVFASTAECDAVEIICTGHYVWNWKAINGNTGATQSEPATEV